MALSYSILQQVGYIYWSYLQFLQLEVHVDILMSVTSCILMRWKLIKSCIKCDKQLVAEQCLSRGQYSFKKSLRDVTSQEVIAKNLRSFLTSLHVRASHGRSCTGKVNYATQVGLIKWNSMHGFEPLISTREVKSLFMPQDFVVSMSLGTVCLTLLFRVKRK